MPEEVFETPQPTPPVAGPKLTNWPKIILAAVFGFALLVGAAYAGYWYGTRTIPSLPFPPTSDQQVEDEEIIKKLVLESTSSFENIENAEISFDQVEIKGNQAVVDVFIRWGEGLGVGYRNTLTKKGGQWFITSRERTIQE